MLKNDVEVIEVTLMTSSNIVIHREWQGLSQIDSGKDQIKDGNKAKNEAEGYGKTLDIFFGEESLSWFQE